MKPFIRKIYYTLLLMITATGITFGPKRAVGRVSGSLLDEQGKTHDVCHTSLLTRKTHQ